MSRRPRPAPSPRPERTGAAKPTVEALGIDIAGQTWQRSGEGAGSIEIAFVRAVALPGDRDAAQPGDPAARPGGSAAAQPGDPAARPGGSAAAQPGDPAARHGGSAAAQPGDHRAARPADWVLMRVAGDPSGRVLVYDTYEWACFLDGVRKGEFDDAAG
jgi:hypothetical protein